jgi:hypothetical protein
MGAMASKMTHEMRAELADVIRRRYKSAEGSEKRRILGEFIGTTGYHEKSAIRKPDIRSKVLAMSAATIDRLLRALRNAIRPRKPRRSAPEPRRRVPLRTFADWNTPQPGCMEMDLVAHCGDVNRGSYINSLVLTDIASGWTEAAPIIVGDHTRRPGKSRQTAR